MLCTGFTCRKIMVQSVYILNILTGQYNDDVNESVRNLCFFLFYVFFFALYFIPDGIYLNI